MLVFSTTRKQNFYFYFLYFTTCIETWCNSMMNRYIYLYRLVRLHTKYTCSWIGFSNEEHHYFVTCYCGVCVYVRATFRIRSMAWRGAGTMY